MRPRLREHVEQRDQQDDAREHLRHQEDVQRRAASPELVARQAVGCGRREQHADDRDRERDEDRVDEPLLEVAAGQQQLVVVEREATGPDDLDLGREDLALHLEAADEDPDGRQHGDDGRDGQDGVAADT